MSTPALADLRRRIDLLEARLARQDDRMPARPTTLRAAHRLNRAAATLATSVLLDSGLEHYRGSFRNPAMFTPLAVASLTLGVCAHGTADHRPAAHRARQAAFALGALAGFGGTAFHAYNILKRPGQFAWQNFFYGAPIGAPLALLLSGLLGSAAEQVRGNPPARLLGVPPGRLLAVISGLGLLGTAGEAGMLHFRGAFHNPAMWAPVTIPPAGGALLLAAAAGPKRRRWLTRAWMRLIAMLGIAGVGFHAWGVHRNMGGWGNWKQNVLNGPPLPAPPSFTGLAIAGLAALGLLGDHPDD